MMALKWTRLTPPQTVHPILTRPTVLGSAKEPQYPCTRRSHQDQRVPALRAKSPGDHLRHFDVPAGHSRCFHRLPAVNDRHVLLQAVSLGQSGMGGPQSTGTGRGLGARATVSVCVHEGRLELGDEAIVVDAVGENVGCLWANISYRFIAPFLDLAQLFLEQLTRR